MPALIFSADISHDNYTTFSKPFFFPEAQRIEWKTFLFDKIQDYEQQAR